MYPDSHYFSRVLHTTNSYLLPRTRSSDKRGLNHSKLFPYEHTLCYNVWYKMCTKSSIISTYCNIPSSILKAHCWCDFDSATVFIYFFLNRNCILEHMNATIRWNTPLCSTKKYSNKTSICSQHTTKLRTACCMLQPRMSELKTSNCDYQFIYFAILADSKVQTQYSVIHFECNTSFICDT